MKRTFAMALAVCGGAASCAMGQNGPRNLDGDCIQLSFTKTETVISVSYAFGDMDRTPGLSSVASTAIAFGGYVGTWCCCAVFDTGPVVHADADSSLGGSASITNGAGLAGEMCSDGHPALVTYEATAGESGTYVHTVNDAGSVSALFKSNPSECTGLGLWAGIGVGYCEAHSGVSFTPSGPNPFLVPVVQVHASFKFAYCSSTGAPNWPECGDEIRFAPTQGVVFDEILIVATDASNVTETHVVQGLVSLTSSLSRQGIYAGPDFETTVDDAPYNLEVEGDSSVEVPFKILPATLATTSSSDSFKEHDGDIDRSGTVDWNDRDDMMALIGISIGQVGYTPRADLDLDGDIDADDFALYAPVFNANACEADYDSSGFVNTSDLFDFQTDFFNNSPRADFNGDGYINSSDYFEFQTAWFNGC